MSNCINKYSNKGNCFHNNGQSGGCGCGNNGQSGGCGCGNNGQSGGCGCGNNGQNSGCGCGNNGQNSGCGNNRICCVKQYSDEQIEIDDLSCLIDCDVSYSGVKVVSLCGSNAVSVLYTINVKYIDFNGCEKHFSKCGNVLFFDVPFSQYTVNIEKCNLCVKCTKLNIALLVKLCRM